MITVNSQEIKDKLLARFDYGNKERNTEGWVVEMIDIPCVLCSLYGNGSSCDKACPLERYKVEGGALGCSAYIKDKLHYNLNELGVLALSTADITWPKKDNYAARKELKLIHSLIETWEVKP